MNNEGLEKILENIQILAFGGKLFDEGQDEVLTFGEILLNCDSDGDGLAYTLKMFSELEMYVEPKSREEELEEKVAELEARLAEVEPIAKRADMTSEKITRTRRTPEEKIALCEKYLQEVRDNGGIEISKQNFAKRNGIPESTFSNILIEYRKWLADNE